VRGGAQLPFSTRGNLSRPLMALCSSLDGSLASSALDVDKDRQEDFEFQSGNHFGRRSRGYPLQSRRAPSLSQNVEGTRVAPTARARLAEPTN